MLQFSGPSLTSTCTEVLRCNFLITSPYHFVYRQADAEASHIALLLEDRLQLVDIRPSIAVPAILPHAFELQTSATTATNIYQTTHRKAIANFRSIPTASSKLDFPYLSGKQSPLPSTEEGDLVVTGHADGCVQLWQNTYGNDHSITFAVTIFLLMCICNQHFIIGVELFPIIVN